MADKTDIEHLIESLEDKRDALQCEIVAFSEYGRFPGAKHFNEIAEKSLELSHIEYALNLIS